MPETVSGGRHVARALRAEGVDCIFTLCGGHVLPIYEGCREERIRVIDVRHEQAAAHAAEAWGRMRRSCGVAVVTAGPGATSTVTAFANAAAAQAPLLVIAGARPLMQAEKLALQELDQASIFRSLGKWTAVCNDTARIPEYVATAFRHAMTPPRGPVYLELPMDVLYAQADAANAPAMSRTTARLYPDPVPVEKAAALLAAAQRPAVIAGSGIWWDGAAENLGRFAEQFRIPVFLNGAARGALPPDHPYFLQHSRTHAMANADLIMVAGAPLDFRLHYGAFNPEAKFIFIHNDGREIGRNRHADIGIIADADAALETLCGAGNRGDERSTWLETLRGAEREWHEAHRHEIESNGAPINHYRLGAELDRLLDAGTTVIGDGGDVVAAVSRVLRVHKPGHWLDPGPFGCLGAGIPYALGVAAAQAQSQPIVVLAGDGSFGFNGMEFETLTRHNIPAVVVIGNDAAWGEVRIPQTGLYGEDAEVATTLAPSAYQRLTEAFGGYGAEVRDPQQLGPVLQAALECGEPAIVNVHLDPYAMAGHPYRGM